MTQFGTYHLRHHYYLRTLSFLFCYCFYFSAALAQASEADVAGGNNLTLHTETVYYTLTPVFPNQWWQCVFMIWRALPLGLRGWGWGAGGSWGNFPPNPSLGDNVCNLVSLASAAVCLIFFHAGDGISVYACGDGPRNSLLWSSLPSPISPPLPQFYADEYAYGDTLGKEDG